MIFITVCPTFCGLCSSAKSVSSYVAAEVVWENSGTQKGIRTRWGGGNLLEQNSEGKEKEIFNI